MAEKLTAAQIGVVSDQSLPVRWPEYVPPSSAVSALVQMPSYRIDGYSVSDAVMKDYRAARKAALRPTPSSPEPREQDNGKP